MKKIISLFVIATMVFAAMSITASASADFYLIGYINGADYGCEGDWENVGDYKFVNGELTVSFNQDSYVFIKTGDNANWYMTEAYIAAGTTSGTFKNTSAGTSEKMFVPGNVELTFTLVDNGDDTFTLSYEEASDDEEIIDSEAVVDSEEIADSEAAEESEAIEDSEVVEESEAVEDSEVVEDSEAADTEGEQDEEDANPPTGDALVVIVALVASIALAGVAVSKKVRA